MDKFLYLIQDGVHVTAKGEWIRASDMTTSHLKNALNYSKLIHPDGSEKYWAVAQAWFTKELEYRKKPIKIRDLLDV